MKKIKRAAHFDFHTLPGGRKLSVSGEYKRVCTLPDMEEVEICAKNGRTEITLPQICGYMPFLIEK